MKVCIGQINTTPGDFDGNLARMKAGIDAASARDCDLVVFPELSIPGYLSQDLIYNPGFVNRNLGVLQELVDYSGNVSSRLHIAVGYIGRHEGVGKPFTNMAAVISHGELLAVYQKQLLPFYDVFDELRYFEPGNQVTMLPVAGRSVGIAICEDLWNDKGTDDYNYTNNPLELYRQAGADVVVSLNSSPYVHGKCSERLKHIAPASADGTTIVYVNQYGGQDELVFDGQSFIVRDGQLLYLNTVIDRDTFDVVDLDADGEREGGEPADTVEPVAAVTSKVAVPDQVQLTDLLVLGLRDYARKSGFTELVLASSGGVDSAVVCKLACDALGPEHVHAIRMPSVFSSDHSIEDAVQLHENLGCWDYEVPIEHRQVVDFLNDHYQVHPGTDNLVARAIAEGRYSGLADENIQARLRDVYLMHFSNAFGAMPLSTGNKTEAGCGYYTHFDMNFSFAPIKDLYKFQVVDIARGDARIPENIWRKPPSAELAEDQTDEASLLPYAILDPIVMAYVEFYLTTFEGFRQWVADSRGRLKVSGDEHHLDSWLARDDAPDDYRRIVSLIGRMEYKRRQTCPGVKVSKVAFGIGRRIPIVEKWS